METSTTLIIVIVSSISVITANITLYIVLKSLRSSRNDLRERREILSRGKPANALINSIQQTSTDMNNQPQVLLELTVTSEAGDTWNTVIKTFIPIVHIPEFQAGKTIDVKYLTIGNQLKVEAVKAYQP